MPQWEYKVVDITSGWVVKSAGTPGDAELTELGMDGWELADTIVKPIGGEASQTTHLIFKRPTE